MSPADILAVIWADMMSFFGIFTNVIEELFLFNHPPVAFLTFATTDPGREQNGGCIHWYQDRNLLALTICRRAAVCYTDFCFNSPSKCSQSGLAR